MTTAPIVPPTPIVLLRPAVLAQDVPQLDTQHIAVVGGLMLGALFIIFLTVAVVVEQRRKLAQTREVEQSRREIAAYVAEGSMTPEDAAKLLNAARPVGERLVERVLGGEPRT